MKPPVKNLIIVLVAAAVLYGGYFYWKNLRGIGPAINPPSGDIADIIENDPETIKPGENTTAMPLKLPDNFKIEIFAKNLSGARVMAFDNFGNMWVSRTSKGIISSIQVENGKVTSQNDIFRNLKNPHGLAFDPKSAGILYFAEENKITRVATYSEDEGSKIADLPSGGGHFTRTLGFGPDNRLYVASGSSCNVCNESDERRATVYSLNSDGSDFKKFAAGLRNTVFFTWNRDGKLWGTDMGRDLLGDNVPPDEINIIQDGKNYGWPICYDDNIHDTNFDKNQYIQDPCNDKIRPQVKLQAHSAPLGLAFVPENSSWPKEYWGDLIVAFHGSWNRSVPTGYDLKRIKLDDKGNYEGIENFVSGWLKGSTALGRPVDVKIQSDGTMYVSDDKAGVIYKITYNK